MQDAGFMIQVKKKKKKREEKCKMESAKGKM